MRVATPLLCPDLYEEKNRLVKPILFHFTCSLSVKWVSCKSTTWFTFNRTLTLNKINFTLSLAMCIYLQVYQQNKQNETEQIYSLNKQEHRTHIKKKKWIQGWDSYKWPWAKLNKTSSCGGKTPPTYGLRAPTMALGERRKKCIHFTESVSLCIPRLYIFSPNWGKGIKANVLK